MNEHCENCGLHRDENFETAYVVVHVPKREYAYNSGIQVSIVWATNIKKALVLARQIELNVHIQKHYYPARVYLSPTWVHAGSSSTLQMRNPYLSETLPIQGTPI